jgi:hypothetical protein
MVRKRKKHRFQFGLFVGRREHMAFCFPSLRSIFFSFPFLF